MEQGQSRHERALYLLRLLVFGWPPTEAQILWIIRIAIVLGILVLVGSELGFTLGEWYPLYIIPALLAAGGYLFDRAQSNRQQRIEEQRAQNTALQDYISAIKDLLLDQGHQAQGQESPNEGARKLARARTLTVLSRLDGGRQGSVVRFLSEAGLINRGDPNRSDPNQGDPVITLGGTRRKRAKIVGPGQGSSSTQMPAGGLGEYAVTLGGCNLEQINLQGADLSGTDLSHINLNYADLTGADLTNVDLSGSLLVGANLIGADLGGATLDNAVFQWANFYGANITDEEIERLKERNALTGAMERDGSRPFEVPPEAKAEFRKHPESQLAHKERELERLASILEQQAGPS